MLHLDRTRRTRRSGEWTEAKAVTFIVTLASTRSVTLAAARARMSRKSAYALKKRDRAFAAAWNEALSAVQRDRRKTALKSVEGDKVCEVGSPPVERCQGNNPSPPWLNPFDAAMREILLAAATNWPARERSVPLAREQTVP